jgi:hypothetical protein
MPAPIESIAKLCATASCVSSREPDDLPAFCREMIEVFKAA